MRARTRIRYKDAVIEQIVEDLKAARRDLHLLDAALVRHLDWVDDDESTDELTTGSAQTLALQVRSVMNAIRGEVNVLQMV